MPKISVVFVCAVFCRHVELGLGVRCKANAARCIANKAF